MKSDRSALLLVPALLLLANLACGDSDDAEDPDDTDEPVDTDEPITDPALTEEEQEALDAADAVIPALSGVAIVARGVALADLEGEPDTEMLEDIVDFFDDYMSVAPTLTAAVPPAQSNIVIGCFEANYSEGGPLWVQIAFNSCNVPFTSILFNGSLKADLAVDLERGIKVTLDFDALTLGLVYFDGTLSLAGSESAYSLDAEGFSVALEGIQLFLDGFGELLVENPVLNPTQITLNADGFVSFNDAAFWFEVVDFVQSSTECFPTSGTFNIWPRLSEDQTEPPDTDFLKIEFGDDSEEEGIVEVTYLAGTKEVTLSDSLCPL